MHRSTRWPTAALAGLAGVLAALAVATSLTQAASSSTTRKITCNASLVAAKPPADTAENFGSTRCSAPLGKGVQHDRSAVTRSSTGSGSVAGPVKLFFNTGTLRGTSKMTFNVANKTVIYEGTITISSGTGEFVGVSGTGTISGKSSDAVFTQVNQKLTLKFPAKKKA